MVIGYIFKPKASQVDDLGAIARDMGSRGYTVGVSRLYELAADRIIEEYRRDPDELLRQLHRFLDNGDLPWQK